MGVLGPLPMEDHMGVVAGAEECECQHVEAHHVGRGQCMATMYGDDHDEWGCPCDAFVPRTNLVAPVPVAPKVCPEPKEAGDE